MEINSLNKNTNKIIKIKNFINLKLKINVLKNI